MRHQPSDIGQGTEINQIAKKANYQSSDDFVLEKSIFNNIFEKDIRRVYIYKKSERLAKALHLIAPAFTDSVSLKNRIDHIAFSLVDAAMLPPTPSRTELSRELLALSSLLSIARTAGIISPMNVDMITREAHSLLLEIASYEQPRLSLEDTLTLSNLAKNMQSKLRVSSQEVRSAPTVKSFPRSIVRKGHLKDSTSQEGTPVSDRREAILSVIKNKGKASIKDISTVIRGVSEKTIQRELGTLINERLVLKQGERRWSVYSLPTTH